MCVSPGIRIILNNLDPDPDHLVLLFLCIILYTSCADLHKTSSDLFKSLMVKRNF